MSLMPLLPVKYLQAPRYAWVLQHTSNAHPGTTQLLCLEISCFGKKALTGTSARGKCKEPIQLCSVTLLVFAIPGANLRSTNSASAPAAEGISALIIH